MPHLMDSLEPRRAIIIVYERRMANLAPIFIAPEPYDPHLRDAPPGLPFRLDIGTLRAV